MTRRFINGGGQMEIYVHLIIMVCNLDQLIKCDKAVSLLLFWTAYIKMGGLTYLRKKHIFVGTVMSSVLSYRFTHWGTPKIISTTSMLKR